jgi:hypothetical protein
MNRIEIILKEQFKLKCKRRLAGKEAVELFVPDFGIAIIAAHSHSAMNDEELYHVIVVDKKQLDNQLYIGSIVVQIFWALIRAGYLRKLRIENQKAHKSLVVANRWGLKIIEHRLNLFGNKPKYRYLIEENKRYLSNFDLSYMTNPQFFDTI